MTESIEMFCMACGEWVEDWGEHKCDSKYWVVTDRETVGIAKRLYNMGIMPLSAIWTATEISDWVDYSYRINVKIDVGCRISEAVLGELPSGWHYFWHTAPPVCVEMHMIAHSERWYNLGFESMSERINEVIRGFEEFLDTRDCEAVKALLLLTSC